MKIVKTRAVAALSFFLGFSTLSLNLAFCADELNRVTAQELKAMMDRGEKVTLIDVRTPEEYSTGYIPGAINIPVDKISELKDFPYEGKVVVYCKSGKRSLKAKSMLSEKGIQGVVDLEGGITAWTQNGRDITAPQKSPDAKEQAKTETYSSYPTNFVVPKGVCEQGIDPAMSVSK